ncbi:unnamed protein product [Darwinula stevensoni]|uniref:Kelch-like protein diablo n=1 Tax=Darwinula stevensoni TaxID=69355 RepID=A0A7R9AF45_9CRUS|nr:unnamed protein product [Darwinula stevensoni]CAG0902675.1 unnamed protein product [Darwinula stevensoni]
MMERTEPVARRKIMLQKDLNDHTWLATGVTEFFRTGPSSCDVVLLIQDAKFYSCKAILAAVSPYFRQMFSSEDFKEPSQREVRLEGFTETGFRLVWDYIHGARMYVEGEDGALAALQDAHYLGLKRLCEKISKTLVDFLTPENAFRTLGIAERYECQDLKEAANAAISVRFNQVIHTADFLSVSFKALTSLLDRDDLEVSSEKDVFEAMKRWVDRDESRKCHLPDLIDKIRLPLLPHEYRKKLIIEDPAISNNPRCLRVCMDAMNYHVPGLRHTVPGGKSRHRGTLSHKIWCFGVKDHERKIYRIDPNDWSVDDVTQRPGGAYVYQPFRKTPTNKCFAGIRRKLYLIGCSEMKIFDVEMGEWEEGPKPPDYIQWPAIASSASSLFICGNYDQQRRTVGGVLQFNAESADWILLTPMKYARYGAGALYKDSVVSVVGGSYPNSTKHERLDLRTPNWKELADHPQGTIYPGLAYAEGGGIVVAGGSGKKEVYAYDARKDAWQQWPSMVEERQGHGLVSLDGTLHAVGGYWNPSVEVFDGTGWEVVKRFELKTCEKACRMSL